MKEKEIIVKNKAGLHARPISDFVNAASKFECDIFIIKDGNKINAKSILSLLTLAAGFNAQLILCADGEHEQKAIDVLSKLLEKGE